jgi:hypothetical protein
MGNSSGNAFVGFSGGASNNNVRVTDNGRWVCHSTLYVGFSDSSNTLTIAGGSVVATNVIISQDIGSNYVVELSSGSLFVTNTLGNATLVVSRIGGKASLILNGGSVTADRIIATNGTNSVVTFNGGALNTKATTVSNAQQFIVGNGAASANFHLLGGVHSFNNGLRIRSNSFLTGCGTINGSVVVDAGGSVVADCGGNLTFTGSVTNNGIMHAQNGGVLEAYGPVVNNGIIDLMDGTTNFHSTFINNGTIVNASDFRVTSIVQEGDNVRISWLAVGGRSCVVQTSETPDGFTDLSPVIVNPGTSLSTTNYLDLGGATNAPSRFYRVWLVP